jgi:hypothetical protein
MSPPNLNWLSMRALSARSFMTVNTVSETCPPNCRPRLPAAIE